MEGWSELISSYPDVPKPKHLAKALHTADNLLSADLASFEIEWLVKTLLYKPVGVLNMFSSKNASEEWLKNIADAFKIISKIVIKYWSVLEDDSEKIVQYCMQPYDPQTKKEAIHCLINVLKKPGVNVGGVGAQVHALEGSPTCKAPLALLIGTICRYHPESVSQHQQYIRIWRIYLKMLQPTQVTDTIVNAVLQGIDGLLDNFGQDLPIAELSDFYNNLSRRCAKLAKCIEPLLSILKSHAGLFKERLREDQVLRLFLWGLNSPSIKGALVAIYDVVFEGTEEQRIQDIIQAEIQPRMESESSLVRLTALRVAMNAKIHHRIRLANMYRPDALEFQLRNRMISHQDAELVSLCLESHEGYTRSLLEATILFFENIPESLRRGVVVQGILSASEDIRKVALNHLVTLSCQDGYLEKYSEIWRGILDSDAPGPEVFEETVHHIAFLMKSLLQAPSINLERVLSLSSVLSFVLSVREKDDRPQYCELLKPILLELSAVLCVSPSSLLSPKYVCVEMFENNTMLQDLLTSLNNNTQVEIVDNISVIQAIFNKDVVDTKLLIKGVSEMDSLLKSGKNIDRRFVVNIMKQILKLKSNMDASTSDNRVLLRNISMFAGEHGKFIEKEDFLDDIYFMEMKNKITINITNYELDLFRVLQISFLWEDPELLYCLLVIISGNLRDRPTAYLQSIAWRCIHSLLKCRCFLNVNPVLQMCATVQCVQQAIESISDEINPEVRRMLCDSVLVMLRHNPGSETTVKLLTLVAEQVLVMIRSPHQPIYECGLDITRIFLATLDENHDLTITYLPEILILMTKKVFEAVYNTAADLFIRHIDIFEESIIKYIITGTINNIKLNKNKVHIELVLMFLKKIFDVKAYDMFLLVDQIFDGLDSAELHIEEDNDGVFVNVLQILLLAKRIFDFDEGMAESVITKKNCVVVNKISTVLENNNVEVTSNILKFLTEYASALINVEENQTIECLCKLIESMPPSIVGLLEKDLSVCILTYRAKLGEMPEEIRQSFHKWVDIFNVGRFNEELNEKLSVLIPVSDASNDFADRVQSLYVMSKIFGVPVIKTDNWSKLLMENGEKVSNTVVSNLLHVANKNLSVTAFENILKDNKDFVKNYLNVYFVKILETSMDLDKDFFVHLLNYFVNNYVEYEEYYDVIVRLMENNWPIFDEKEKLAVASDFLRLPRDVGQIAPVRWVIQLIIEGEIIEDKIEMITMLPGGEMYSKCYQRAAGLLPVRVSEAREHAGVLRALLDALARTGDHVLLSIVVNLAAADDTRGWWDNAIDACMASLAKREDENICDAAFSACKKRSGMGCYRRVLVPLLRHSSRAFCEQFTSTIIQEVLSTLKTGYKEPSNTDMYKERVISYAKAFAILHVVMEKLSYESLKSGRLNESVSDGPVPPPWHFVKLVCTYSVTLMDKVRCPDDATEEIRQACLHLQCAAYNCLTSAICKSRLSQKQYTIVFNTTAWSKIVDPEVENEFQPRAYWGESRSREQRVNRSGASSSFTRTVRTRIFMTTLSENPLQYDMIPNDDEEEGDEDTDPVGYNNHPLNAHGCLTTITKLLHHASTLEHTEWLSRLSEGLTSSSLPLNARWTLAQAVCYTEADLEAHASTLIPPLLELIAATPKLMNNKQTLNNLHIDILWTIIKWSVPELSSYNHLSTSVQYLVHSCMEYRTQKAVSSRLLNTLNSLLVVYGTRVQVPWAAFEEYCNDNTENISFLLPIFQRILRNGIALPDLMPYILRIDASLWKNKLPDVFGLAFSLDKREEYLETFWQILGKVKKNVSDFVKALLCATRVCARCCNKQLFKTIIDLAPKVENANCLAIIGIYLDNLEQDDGSCGEVFETIDLMALLDSNFKLDAMKVVHGGYKFMDEAMRNAVMSSIGQNCQSGLIAVRKQAFAVMLKAFQDMVQVKDERLAKRQATSGTRILKTLRSNIGYHHQVIEHLSRGLFDADADISDMIRDGVNVYLSEDMAERLAELFYLIFYYLKHDRLELSEYGYVFLDLLFSHIKQQDVFKNKKYSEQPLPTSNINDGCATFTSGVTNRQKQISNKYYLRNIDVEMALVDILEVFLQSAKRNSQICLELCVQVMRRVQAESSGPRFDLGEVMAELLITVLNKEPNSLTPLYLEASRIFMNKVSHINGFRDSLNVLQNKVRDENLLYLNTVYEDFILRKEGRNFFNFSVKGLDVEMKSENQGFSIKGLVEVFGHLANWDDVRAQDKRNVEELLPPLLVEEKQFESALKEYILEGLSPLGYSHWFNKMAGACCADKFNQTMTQYKQHWLADAQRWPTADFVTSAVIEATKWPQETVVKACEIRPHECLAEWAGRLMIRAAYYTGESNQSVCRGDELRWCSDANKRHLPRLALQCIERNKSSLMEDEALAWFHQKIQAHRVLALKTNDGTMLRKTLDAAVRQDTGHDLCLKRLILQLHTDLGSLSKSDLDAVFLSIDRNNNSLANGADTSSTNGDIKSIYDIAMNYYDDQWDDNDVSSQAEIISSMVDIIEKYLNYNLSKEHNLLISVLLNKLTLYEGTLDEQTAKKILSQIVSMLPELDSFSVNHLKTISHVFPKEVWSEHQGMNDEEALAHCKEYLRLICDPQYTLLQFCDRLLRERDSDRWCIIFAKMKSTLFGTSYGGTEYIALNNFKNKLFAIENATNDERLTTVRGIREELMKKSKRSGLRLSQLSPQLTRSQVLEEQAHHLGKLLALPTTLRIVKFEEQVHMFGDSIRRPCVVSVLLSNGVTKRYIIKTGEPLDNDASVQRAIAILPKLFKVQVRSYNVTTLTEESAIIECLEAHERLRDLMGTKVNIPDNRINDDSVVLSPSLALEQFTAMCNRLPVETLRSSIESRCASTQEFISKKQVFLETLSSMTITNWLFGVGDRHFYNIMWSKRDGGICGVDWASVFQYGLREFVPARLTAGLLAVCDVKVLEARLQNILENLRQNRKLYDAFVRTSFYWKGRDFKESTYIKGILYGHMVSYQITRDIMDQSNILHKENCIGILDSVFENFQFKQTYTVEEQVSCLLKHCTEPGLLAVIPSGWEAFV